MRKVSVLFLLVFMIPFSAAPVEAEDPHNQDCEGVVVPMLCAGADAGSNGGCDGQPAAEISCWYTYGWNLNASSAAQLPGGGLLQWTYEVTYCITGEGCTLVESGGGDRECAWTLNAAEPCWEFHVDGGDLDFVLELGQCVEVTATVDVQSDAWAFEEQDPLFQVSAQMQSEESAAACHLDDGRG